MRYFTLLVMGFILCPLLSLSQPKKVLTHQDYAHWKNLSGIQISPSGDHVLYLENPQRLDGNLWITSLSGIEATSVARGRNAAFSPGSKFAVFHIEPQRDTVRAAKVAEKRPHEMPKDSLGIYLMDRDSLITYEKVLSYRLPKESSHWLAFAKDHTRIKEQKPEQENHPSDTIPEPLRQEEIQEEEPETETLKQLIIKNPIDGYTHTFDHVEHYQISENGQTVIFLQEEPNDNEDTLQLRKLFVFDTQSQSLELLDSARGDYKHLSVHKEGQIFAWLFSADTAEVKVYDLYVHQADRRRAAKHIIHSETDHMPEGYTVSEFGNPSFSDDGRRVYFGVAPAPQPEKEDTLLDEEKYRLDIWHWQDAQLQSQQQASQRRDRERNFEAVLHLRSGNMSPLAGDDMPQIVKDRKGEADLFMGISNLPYQREGSWLGITPRDVYLVNAQTGQRQRILEKATSNVHFSEQGKYIIYYNTENNSWYSYSADDDMHRNLTQGLGVSFYNEDNDIPLDARPYGIAGWGENDRYVLVYDKYDIWKLDPRGRRQAQNITAGYGRDHHIRFRYQDLDPDQHYIPDRKIWLSAFNDQNKQGGFYSLDMRTLELERLMVEDAAFLQLQKAKEQDVFIWRKSTFQKFPDLYTSHPDFTNIRRISDANPQQSEYLWGSVSLVEWRDFNNDTLQGLLYLPEDFDPEGSYPLIVYFYERSSHNLHRHYVPSPSRSIINPPYCTSNGYIVFVPDITYQTGFPGQSAYNAVVSGTKAMVERYPFINRDRMGLQGQSWGGYQIAYLITQTHMFRAAMAGAPVSNMVSAYGGIRWASGLSRQFQYEQTQSRIGGTLWEKPFHYIENSPVFFADKIQTPLLIMHNDDDGAVPWYQGIELFVAMRRLDRPVWMLVYNDEAHNLRQWPNRMDLSVRMYQFFDHYLKDQPAPQWLREGRPFLEKDRTDAYELIE